MTDYELDNNRHQLNFKLKNNILSASADTNEYLLNPENNRLTVYPIKNQAIWTAYKIQQAAFLFLSDHPDQHYEHISSALKDGYAELEKYDIDASFIVKDTFLSARNLNMIQKWICMEVLKRTNIIYANV